MRQVTQAGYGQSEVTSMREAWSSAAKVLSLLVLGSSAQAQELPECSEGTCLLCLVGAQVDEAHVQQYLDANGLKPDGYSWRLEAWKFPLRVTLDQNNLKTVTSIEVLDGHDALREALGVPLWYSELSARDPAAHPPMRWKRDRMVSGSQGEVSVDGRRYRVSAGYVSTDKREGVRDYRLGPGWSVSPLESLHSGCDAYRSAERPEDEVAAVEPEDDRPSIPRVREYGASTRAATLARLAPGRTEEAPSEPGGPLIEALDAAQHHYDGFLDAIETGDALFNHAAGGVRQGIRQAESGDASAAATAADLGRQTSRDAEAAVLQGRFDLDKLLGALRTALAENACDLSAVSRLSGSLAAVEQMRDELYRQYGAGQLDEERLFSAAEAMDGAAVKSRLAEARAAAQSSGGCR